MCDACRNQKGLSGILLLPITNSADVPYADSGIGQQLLVGCGVPGGTDQRSCLMPQLLCWAFISSFAIGSSPSDGDSPVKSSGAAVFVSLETWEGRG